MAENKRNVEINKAIGAGRSVSDVLRITQREADVLNIVNCATALGRIAKLAPASMNAEETVQQITCRAARCFESEQCQPRHVAQVLWACAKLKFAPSNLLCNVLHSASRMQPAWFKPQEISMTIWALGKLAVPDKDGAVSSFVHKILPSALSRSAEFDPQGLANVISGVANVGVPAGSSVVCKLLASVRGRLGGFCPQEVANSLHGLAKLGARVDECEGLASEAAQVLRELLGDFTPQQLANCAWATTKLLERALRQQDRQNLDFWHLFAQSVHARIHEFNAQELSMCTWAAAQSLSSSVSHDMHDIARFAAAVGEAASTLASADSMDAQQLATITLAYTKLGCTTRAHLRCFSHAARERMKTGDFKAQDLDNLASGFGRHELQFKSKKLVTALALAGTTLLRDARMPPRNAANLLMAVAKLASACKQACAGTAELAAAAARMMSSEEGQGLAAFNLRDLANAAWGLAVLQHASAHPACMQAIARQAARSLDTFNAQEMSKLLYAMGLSGVRCKELEDAAGAQRVLEFEFAPPVGALRVEQMLGGTQREFLVREDTGAIAGNGGALFEDAFVLADWLARQSTPAKLDVRCAVTGRRVVPRALRTRGTWEKATMLELGAGLGLCSLVARRLGMCVCATDGDESVLQQLRHNAKLNSSRRAAEGGGRDDMRELTDLRSEMLKWGGTPSLSSLGFVEAPDLVVATGCVYGRDAGVWASLVHTLRLVAGGSTLVILAHGNGAAPGVHQLRGDFYDYCRPYFQVWRVPQQELAGDHPNVQLHLLVRRAEPLLPPEPQGKCKKRDINTQRGWLEGREDHEAMEGEQEEEEVEEGGRNVAAGKRRRRRRRRKRKQGASIEVSPNA